METSTTTPAATNPIEVILPTQTTKVINPALLGIIKHHAPKGLQSEESVKELSTQEFLLHLRMEWVRDDGETRASLSVIPTRLGRVEDAHGNVWRKYTVQVTVGYASYGNCTIESTEKRLKLGLELCEFGRLLRIMFEQPVYELVMTAEQKEAQKAELTATERRKISQDLLKNYYPLKGMRVGTIRECNRVNEIESGIYPVEGKTYEVNVIDHGKMKYTRLA